MDSILFSSPVLIVLCLAGAFLHILDALLGGKRWLSFINLIYHLGTVIAFLWLGATLADLLIFLMLSSAVCLALRLRRATK